MRVPNKLRIILRPYLRRSKWFRCWNGERVLRGTYKDEHKKDLDLENVNAFSEKIIRRMILINRHGNTTYTRLADKYLVRDYVREKIGDRHLIKLIWHGANPFDIPFDKLPQKYVIKTNHGSGYNIIVDGYCDRKKISNNLRIWLDQNFYWVNYEYHYFTIPPRILVEEFIDDGEPDGPLDYYFWCFDGVPEIIQIGNRTHSTNAFYDTSWNKLNLHYRKKFTFKDVRKPQNFDEMLTVAAKLSGEFDFVRLDLYNVRGQIFFGEYTFTPFGGHFPLKPDSWDLRLGQKWRI